MRIGKEIGDEPIPDSGASRDPGVKRLYYTNAMLAIGDEGS